MSVDNIIKKINNSMIGKAIFIVIALPCYITVTSSWGVCMEWIVTHRPELHLIVIYIRYWGVLTLYIRMLNQFQNWILREPILLWL